MLDSSITNDSFWNNELMLGGVTIKTFANLFEYVTSKYQINQEKNLSKLNFTKWESELASHAITSVFELMRYCYFYCIT